MSENSAILGFFDYALEDPPFQAQENKGVIRNGLPGSSIYTPVYDTNNCMACLKTALGCDTIANASARRDCEQASSSIMAQKYLSLDPFMAQRTRIRTGFTEETNYEFLRLCSPLCGNEQAFVAG